MPSSGDLDRLRHGGEKPLDRLIEKESGGPDPGATRRRDDGQRDLLAPPGGSLPILAAFGLCVALVTASYYLAIDRLAVDVTASPNLVTDPVGVAARLAPILKM